MSAGLRRLAPLMICGFGLGCAAFSQELARDLFDNTIVQDIRIDLDPADWTALKQNYLDNTYYHANLSWGSQSARDVGIRSRGRGSRSPDKPNLDVNVDKYVKKQKFADLAFFVLKANNQDPSLMRESLAFALFRKMGLSAPREAPARLSINGEYFGVYAAVEHEDEDFLNRNLGEDGGDLFEWKPETVYEFEDLGDDPAAYAIFLDPKTNEDSPNYQAFIDMVKSINYAPDSDFVNAVSRYLDLKLYLTHAATENVLSEIDGIWAGVLGMNNFYLYRFEGQDLFQFIPWDKDLTFLDAHRDVIQTASSNVLARRLLAIPEYRTFYLSQVAKAADFLGAGGGWADREVTRLYTLIHDAALNDPHKQCIQAGSPAPCGPQEFEQGVQDLRNFIAERAAIVKNGLAQQGYERRVGGPLIFAVIQGSSSGGPLRPGSTARILGIGLGPEVPPSTSRSFVAVEGVRVPILSMSRSEAVIRIPSDIPAGITAVAVAVDGALSNTISVLLN